MEPLNTITDEYLEDFVLEISYQSRLFKKLTLERTDTSQKTLNGTLAELFSDLYNHITSITDLYESGLSIESLKEKAEELTAALEHSGKDFSSTGKIYEPGKKVRKATPQDTISQIADIFSARLSDHFNKCLAIQQGPEAIENLKNFHKQQPDIMLPGLEISFSGQAYIRLLNKAEERGRRSICDIFLTARIETARDTFKQYVAEENPGVTGKALNIICNKTLHKVAKESGLQFPNNNKGK